MKNRSGNLGSNPKYLQSYTKKKLIYQIPSEKRISWLNPKYTVENFKLQTQN